MAHYNFPLLIIIPGIHNLACCHDIKITCYTDRTLLNFVEIYPPIHCYTIPILLLYFHGHILCTLYQNLTNLEIIYDGVLLHRCFVNSLMTYHCFNVSMNNFCEFKYS